MGAWISIAGGLLALVAGGELLVRGTAAGARHFGVSPLLIGLVLVGFGTSTPELVTSVQASLVGSPGIAVGNVVGSNIANILLVLGIAAVIFPLATSPAALRRDGAAVLAATLLCVGVVLIGELGRPAGVALIALLLAYVLYTYLHERRIHDASAAMHEAEAAALRGVAGRPWLAVPIALGGLLLTLLGARLLVHGAIDLAVTAGLSESLIGLTIVAVGTSLPELATSVVAAMRRQSDIAFGNIVGSNIFNALGILGAAAVVRPIAVPADIADVDIWVMLAATALMLVFAATGRRVSRSEGGVFLAAYVGYLAFLALET